MTFLQIVRALLGVAPNYFTVGTSTTPQWHYGNLLEYFFAGMAFLMVIIFTFKFLNRIVDFISSRQ